MKFKLKKILVQSLTLYLFLGFICVGQNDIVCISNDGRIKFEAECTPCCTDMDESCALVKDIDHHEDHIDCSDCSDLTVGGVLWSNRFTKINLSDIDNSGSLLVFQNRHNLNSLDKNSIEGNNNFLSYYKNPQSIFIATTIIRC